MQELTWDRDRPLSASRASPTWSARHAGPKGGAGDWAPGRREPRVTGPHWLAPSLETERTWAPRGVLGVGAVPFGQIHENPGEELLPKAE